ncbi:hypothetical protein [Curtobacterium sp. L1-20]|uniref:hypothetical protein n=1 Tax=Curtobacterium sp. L1-20 TaxID=3138181 RepID=UPI003B523B48
MGRGKYEVRRAAWVPGVVGLVVIAVWTIIAIAVFAHAAPVHDAYQSSLAAMQNPDPLADPPRDVAIVDLQIAVMLVLALPSAVTALFLGLGAVLAFRGRGWALAPSWIAAGIGGLGVFPALLAFFAGLVGGVFNGLVVFG